jgi:hypothetical protein
LNKDLDDFPDLPEEPTYCPELCEYCGELECFCEGSKEPIEEVDHE